MEVIKKWAARIFLVLLILGGISAAYQKSKHPEAKLSVIQRELDKQDQKLRHIEADFRVLRGESPLPMDAGTIDQADLINRAKQCKDALRELYPKLEAVKTKAKEFPLEEQNKFLKQIESLKQKVDLKLEWTEALIETPNGPADNRRPLRSLPR
jgi:hypothetical protein